MNAHATKESNVPTLVEAVRTGPSGRTNVPDLSEHVQDTSGEILRPTVYRGWAWIVCAEHRLQGAPPSLVATFHPLIKTHILIGNNAEVCDLVFNSGRISREHAEIEFDLTQGLFYVSDRGSTNGTFVRPPGGAESRVLSRQTLADGSRLRLADDVVLIFRGFCQKGGKP